MLALAFCVLVLYILANSGELDEKKEDKNAEDDLDAGHPRKR
jgi:hypothetical protein